MLVISCAPPCFPTHLSLHWGLALPPPPLPLTLLAQQTVLNLIEKQPVVVPDTIEAIAAPVPAITPEQNADRIDKLKKRVRDDPGPVT